jgi:hypothetical protein
MKKIERKNARPGRSRPTKIASSRARGNWIAKENTTIMRQFLMAVWKTLSLRMVLKLFNPMNLVAGPRPFQLKVL